MRNKHIKRLVMAALLTAMTTVATMVIQIPSPMNGYVNLGDCLVLLSAWMLGPFVGAAAAGIGSMLADLLTGYAFYAPATLIIKAGMALVAGLIFRGLAGGDTRPTWSRVLVGQLGSGVAAEIIMIGGYFLYAAWVLQNGLGAVASIPGNLVQAVFGLVAAVVLGQALSRARALTWLSH